jgi:hypothetical protein
MFMTTNFVALFLYLFIAAATIALYLAGKSGAMAVVFAVACLLSASSCVRDIIQESRRRRNDD